MKNSMDHIIISNASEFIGMKYNVLKITFLWWIHTQFWNENQKSYKRYLSISGGIKVLHFQKNKRSPKSLWNKYFFAEIKNVIRKSCRFTILAMLKPQLYPISLPILEVFRLHQKIREKRENMVLRGFADAATVIVILINHFSLPSYLDLILKVISFYRGTNKDCVLQ